MVYTDDLSYFRKDEIITPLFTEGDLKLFLEEKLGGRVFYLYESDKTYNIFYGYFVNEEYHTVLLLENTADLLKGYWDIVCKGLDNNFIFKNYTMVRFGSSLETNEDEEVDEDMKKIIEKHSSYASLVENLYNKDYERIRYLSEKGVLDMKSILSIVNSLNTLYIRIKDKEEYKEIVDFFICKNDYFGICLPVSTVDFREIKDRRELKRIAKRFSVLMKDIRDIDGQIYWFKKYFILE